MNQVSLKLFNKIVTLPNIKMIVFDMAGTTINEGGMVYMTLFKTMKMMNLNIKGNEIDSRWHGINKYEVMDYYLYKTYGDNYNKYKKATYSLFSQNLNQYYNTSNNISLVSDNIPNIFNNLREKNIKICLNTGYSNEVQELLINKFNMNEFIDDYISSEDVPRGRPFPYMIHNLMQRNNIGDVRQVIKVGDTVNDIKEGIQAGCHSVGVLTGAESFQELSQVSDNVFILKDVTKIS